MTDIGAVAIAFGLAAMGAFIGAGLRSFGQGILAWMRGYDELQQPPADEKDEKP